VSLYDVPLTTIDGTPTSMQQFQGDVLLVVNVASRCGFTPQYTGLQQLYDTYRSRGFQVLGFPCNQFLFQEPGGAEAIAKFCSTRYDVTFPLFEKVHVKGRRQHPLYTELCTTPTADGETGNVKWNFEKFLVGRDGKPVGRYRTKVEPLDPGLVADIEKALG
jgi:glutathione peroxidase